MFSMTALLHFL